MKPFEIAALLGSAESPEEILASLSATDPFWIGASYAIDPFVGMIVRLPIRKDPPRYGPGLKPQIFETFVKAVLDNRLAGDELVITLEAMASNCQEDEWLFWYKRILKGEMDIPVPLGIFNRHAPSECQIPPPALSKPKQFKKLEDLPKRFVLQPVYPRGRMFWLIDSQHQPIEIYGYDGLVMRVRDQAITEILAEFAAEQPMNIVLIGYPTGGSFIAEDIITREQFTQETSPIPLQKRLEAMKTLGIPVAQMSPELHPEDVDQFFKETRLIFEQGYHIALIRDLDGRYPFRMQPDWIIGEAAYNKLLKERT